MNRLSSEPALTPMRIGMPAVAGGLGDLLDPAVELLDVAGVDAHRGAAGVDRGEDVLGLEVDVGDHRDLAVPGDLGQRVGVLLPRARHPDDVAAGRGQLGDLLQRGVDVVGLGGASSTAPRSGWSLPTPTLPTISWRVLRRGASVGAGGAGMPRPICWPVAIGVSYWNSLIGLTKSAVTVSAM